jgi:hypothetical protein
MQKEWHTATKPLKKRCETTRGEKKNERDRYQLLNTDHNPCCGFGMFIPDPNFFIPDPNFSIPDPGSKWSASKNLSIFNPKIFYKLWEISGMFIPDQDLDFLPSPDPGVKKAPDPRSATMTIIEENGNDLLPCLSHFWRAFSRAFPVALLPSVFNHSLKRKVNKLF